MVKIVRGTKAKRAVFGDLKPGDLFEYINDPDCDGEDGDVMMKTDEDDWSCIRVGDGTLMRIDEDAAVDVLEGTLTVCSPGAGSESDPKPSRRGM